YPGVTVERRVGRLRTRTREIELVDIPGCYSLVARTGEEQIAAATLAGLGAPRPDVVIVCVDATQLVRSSYLVLQALELGTRLVAAMTMIEEAGGTAPDVRALGAALGCEVVAVNGRHRAGIGDLVAALDRALDAGPADAVWRWTPSPALARRLDTVRAALPAA